ncbi:MAG: 6,7-dimethyl-8-ribityllumazine synthase [Candidatus Freyarchaeota archaeon]
MVKVAGEGVNLGIVVSEFNYDITYLMLQRAVDHAEFLGAKVVKVVKVPGAFDMPLAVKKLLERGDVDAVVTIGAIIKGDTDHDQVVAQHAARKMVDLALEYGKPVTLGVSGPGMTRMEAMERIEEFARRAVEAAVKMVKRMREVST